MLTRSKKKHTASRDKSGPQNSNEKHFAAPANDSVEVGEMVTMGQGGTSSGDMDSQRMAYLQVAWLLREKLNDLVDGDKGEFPGLALRSLLDMVVSHNIVSMDPKMLNPVLWRTLPKELLLHVFARLPLPDINRLRCVSREWRSDMATLNSEINQALDEASPPMVALLSPFAEGKFWVTIYDFTKRRWQYAYYLHLLNPWSEGSERWPHVWTAMSACDDGLVCFLSRRKPRKGNGLCMVVVNLLTRVQRELPPMHCEYYPLPAMVQMKVDFDTKCYKVVVAAYVKGHPIVLVEIYNSGTKQWTRATLSCDPIFGSVHSWTTAHGFRYELTPIPGAYDFAKGKLEIYGESNPYNLQMTGSMINLKLLDWVFQKDCLFVLLAQTQMDASHQRMVLQAYLITEYHVESEMKGWVPGRSYECPPFEELWRSLPLVSNLSLKACDGFLMVIVHLTQTSQHFWVLDLSTSEWNKITEISKGVHAKGSLLCRLAWNVIP